MGFSGIPIKGWECSDVTEWVSETLQFPQYVECFEAGQTSGMRLVDMSDAELAELGVSSRLHRKRIMVEAYRLANSGEIPDAAELSLSPAQGSRSPSSESTPARAPRRSPRQLKLEEADEEAAAVTIQGHVRQRNVRKKTKAVLDAQAWAVCINESGRKYYFNKTTQETSWTRPAVIDDVDQPIKPVLLATPHRLSILNLSEAGQASKAEARMTLPPAPGQLPPGATPSWTGGRAWFVPATQPMQPPMPPDTPGPLPEEFEVKCDKQYPVKPPKYTFVPTRKKDLRKRNKKVRSIFEQTNFVKDRLLCALTPTLARATGPDSEVAPACKPTDPLSNQLEFLYTDTMPTLSSVDWLGACEDGALSDPFPKIESHIRTGLNKAWPAHADTGPSVDALIKDFQEFHGAMLTRAEKRAQEVHREKQEGAAAQLQQAARIWLAKRRVCEVKLRKKRNEASLRIQTAQRRKAAGAVRDARAAEKAARVSAAEATRQAGTQEKLDKFGAEVAKAKAAEFQDMRAFQLKNMLEEREVNNAGKPEVLMQRLIDYEVNIAVEDESDRMQDMYNNKMMKKQRLERERNKLLAESANKILAEA